MKWYIKDGQVFTIECPTTHGWNTVYKPSSSVGLYFPHNKGRYIQIGHKCSGAGILAGTTGSKVTLPWDYWALERVPKGLAWDRRPSFADLIWNLLVDQDRPDETSEAPAPATAKE